MPYNVTYTESNTNKSPITVADETLNNQTSLTFVGKNYAGYGHYVANNFLHLLENFANTTSPANPVQGQIWFDSSNNQLMINNDGTSSNWTPAGSVQKAPTKPSVANIGDIWVDTINQQLSIYTGTGDAWTLVGPLLSQGTVTGQKIEKIEDSANNFHNIISLFSSNVRVALVSTDNFIPKVAIAGFSNIKAGITLNSTSSYKFNGTATNADSLGGINSSKYVRNDQPNQLTAQLSAPAIKIGNDTNFVLSSDPLSSSNYLISSDVRNNSIEIRVLDSLSNVKSVAYFSPEQRVGIATVQPASTLDVNGTITVSSGVLKVAGTADVSNSGPQTASIQTSGGLYVNKSASIGTNLTVLNGALILNKLDTTVIPNVPTIGPVILPGYQTHDNTGALISQPLYEIGSKTHQFRQLYVENFIGDVIGNVTGNLTGQVVGNVSGSASFLSNTTEFSLSGDVTSDVIYFTGSGTPITFNATLSQAAVSSKQELPDSNMIDEFMVYRQFAARVTGYISGTTLTIGSISFGSALISPSMAVLGVDTTPIPVGNFIVGDQYTIIEFGTTTNIQWNTIAGTLGQPYSPGTVFTAANTGAGLGNGTAYFGVNTVALGTTIISGSGNSWTISQSQTVGSPSSPVTLYIGSSELYRTSKQTFVQDIPSIQIGSIILYPGTVLPPGYLLCDGAIYLISQYPSLSTVLGSTFAVPGSSVNFSVPNMSPPISAVNYIIYSGVI